MFSNEYRCADCGSAEGYRSRPRTFLEKYILPLLLLQRVRCGKCFRRSTESLFAGVHEREASPDTRPRAA